MQSAKHHWIMYRLAWLLACLLPSDKAPLMPFRIDLSYGTSSVLYLQSELLYLQMTVACAG